MLLIKNAKIYTMSDRVIVKGDILIENGKIKRVADKINIPNVKTEEVIKEIEIIDAEGLIAIPGLIDGHVHIGGLRYNEYGETWDVNETSSPVTSEVDASNAIDVTSPDFRCAYENGITTVGLAPGSGCVIGGQVIAAKTFGDNIFDMTIKNPVALKVAMGGNPKTCFGYFNLEPATRMSIINIVRDFLKETKIYMELTEKRLPYKEKKYTEKQLQMAIPVLKREIPLKIHSTRHDMIAIINAIKEFNVKFTLDHAWGAEKYIDEIVQSNAGIMFGPIGSYRGMGEGRSMNMSCLDELDKKGVLISLITDAPILSISSLLNIAGEAVRQGMDVERALRMVTINPAKLMGIEDKVGSLEEGKDADIVLFSGMPSLDLDAKVIYSIINGEIVYEYYK